MVLQVLAIKSQSKAEALPLFTNYLISVHEKFKCTSTVDVFGYAIFPKIAQIAY